MVIGSGNINAAPNLIMLKLFRAAGLGGKLRIQKPITRALLDT